MIPTSNTDLEPCCAESIRCMARADAERDLKVLTVDAYGAFAKRRILADVHREDYVTAYVLRQVEISREKVPGLTARLRKAVAA